MNPCGDADATRELLEQGWSRFHQGHMDQAIECFRLALSGQPRSPDTLAAWGQVLLVQGRSEEGFQYLLEALRIRPDHVVSLTILAQGLADAGEPDESIRFFLRALDYDSDWIPALVSLGRLLLSLGRTAEARIHLERALAVVPDHSDALTCLGMVLQRLGEWDLAEAKFRHALRVHPDVCQGHNNYGSALLERGAFAEAARQFRLALQQCPEYPLAVNNLGVAWHKEGQILDAMEQFRHALRLKPDYFAAANNLGLACQELGRLDEALEWFQLACRINPDFADARYNEGLIWLTRGDFERGWRGYESRLGMARYRNHLFFRPAWALSLVPGGRVLVYCEQGFGDNIQFIRLVTFLAQAAMRVTLVCPGALARLFSTAPGIDCLVVDETPAMAEYDLHLPLLSLPCLFGIRPHTLSFVPYLAADASGMAAFRELFLPFRKRLRIGLVWRGNPKHLLDRYRSMPPGFFSTLLDLEGCSFIGLQKDATADELKLFMVAGDNFLDLGGRLHDFADTALAVAHLDVVIAVDTAVAHLAGAMGRPVWLLLPAVADWRWLLDTETSPWYPTMRLFRQATPGDWAGVLARVKGCLHEWIARPIHSPVSSEQPCFADARS
ncbi:MAG: tetratricopeptide repeat protein [Magnetococcales bacterium]|nr:tetratricopeptide repeat protein [Magnetococcales bacterium]